MITATLVFRNGDRRGEEIAVQSRRFRIGRHPKCQLFLKSDLVSRLHCVLVQQDDQISIQDLGSRNGTYVNGRKLAKDESCPLTHRDKIQVGGWKLRIFVLDAQTRRPVDDGTRPDGTVSVDDEPSSSAAQLLQELDEMTTHMEMKGSGATGSRQRARRSEWVMPDPQVDPNAARSPTSAATPSPGPPSPGQPSPPPTELADQPTAGGAVAESHHDTREAEGPKSKPGKLPEHLRPKHPADSKDAASEALRRIFDS